MAKKKPVKRTKRITPKFMLDLLNEINDVDPDGCRTLLRVGIRVNRGFMETFPSNVMPHGEPEIAVGVGSISFVGLLNLILNRAGFDEGVAIECNTATGDVESSQLFQLTTNIK